MHYGAPEHGHLGKLGVRVQGVVVPTDGRKLVRSLLREYMLTIGISTHHWALYS